MPGANRKKQRKSKTSRGINGAKRHPLSEVEKVRLGKGLFVTFLPIGSGS